MTTETLQDERRARRRELRQLPRQNRAPLLAEFEQFPLDALCNELHNAAYRGCSRSLVQLERVRGTGVPFLKTPSGQVRYRKADILRFCADRFKRFHSTSQYPDAA